MHFGTKSYLKSNRNHTAKQTLNKTPCWPIFDLAEDNYGLMYSCFAYLYILTKPLTFPFAC
jgi:hypothetical protein